MIQRIIIFIILLPFLSFSQPKNITYNQANDISFAKQYKNNTTIDSYTTRDGVKINIGDTLTIGNAVIERKKHMIHDVFSYIVVGQAKGTTNKGFRYLPHNYSGDKVIVQSLYVMHEKYTGYKLLPNRREMPLYVSVFVKNPKSNLNSIKGLSNTLSYSRKTIIDIEKALLEGEIVNYNAPLSREEAIKKLRESKDLMELDLLSKEEYEKLRQKLTPIILKD